MRDFFRSPAHLDKAADWLTGHRLNQREPVTGRLLESTRLADLIFRGFAAEDENAPEELPGDTGPRFETLCPDLFTALYSPALRRRDEDAVFRRERLYNKPILDNVLRDDRYAELKALCESREYPAYTAAAVFCRSLRQSMTEITPEIPQLQFLPIIDKLTEQEQVLTAQIDRLLSGAAGVPPRKLLYLYNRIFRKASQIADLRKKVEEGAVRYIRAVIMHIGSALDAALEAARQTNSILQAWGDGSGEMKNTPANRELLNYVRNSEMLQKIAAYLGRYREILAAKRQNSFAYGRGEKYDIGFGSDINSCLASELALLGAPETEVLFMRRFQQKKLMQYRKREALIKGEGDMIVLLDESSSTRLMAGWAKAITLALLDVAARGRRKFALVHFSTTTKTELFEPGHYQTADILRAAEHFFNGGTNFERPLKEAIRLLQNGFENADITIITDGESALTDEFTKEFRETLRRQRAAMTGILLDKDNACGKTLEPFCDRIFRTKELTEDEIAVQLLDRKTS